MILINKISNLIRESIDISKILTSALGELSSMFNAFKAYYAEYIDENKFEVTEIYPKEGNEAGKIDLLKDSKRGKISNYAKDHNITIIQGPIKLKQGGSRLVVRNPIYLEE